MLANIQALVLFFFVDAEAEGGLALRQLLEEGFGPDRAAAIEAATFTGKGSFMYMTSMAVPTTAYSGGR